MTQETMYPQTVGDKSTTLTAAFRAGTDGIARIENFDVLPPEPNMVAIRKPDSSALVIIKYNSHSPTSIIDVTVIEGDSPEALTATYPAGSIVSRPLCKADVDAIQNNIRDHVEDTTNPHNVTPDQIGLGDVDNTSDEDKPLSAAQRSSNSNLNGIIAGVESEVLGHKANRANPHSVTKEQVGLGSTQDGAQINVLESVKIGGTPLTILNKSVDITTIPEILTPLENVSVSNWTLQTTPDVAGYPYRAAIPYSGVTADHFASVTYRQDDAVSGIFAAICQTAANTVYVYAQTSKAVTIATVVAGAAP